MYNITYFDRLTTVRYVLRSVFEKFESGLGESPAGSEPFPRSTAVAKIRLPPNRVIDRVRNPVRLEFLGDCGSHTTAVRRGSRETLRPFFGGSVRGETSHFVFLGSRGRRSVRSER